MEVTKQVRQEPFFPKDFQPEWRNPLLVIQNNVGLKITPTSSVFRLFGGGICLVSIKKLECRRSGHTQKHTETDCVKKMRAIFAGQCTDGQKQTKGSTIYTWG